MTEQPSTQYQKELAALALAGHTSLPPWSKTCKPWSRTYLASWSASLELCFETDASAQGVEKPENENLLAQVLDEADRLLSLGFLPEARLRSQNIRIATLFQSQKNGESHVQLHGGYKVFCLFASKHRRGHHCHVLSAALR